MTERQYKLPVARRAAVAKSLRERRIRLKAEGICLHCGTAEARKGMTTCAPCAKKHCERVQRTATQRKAGRERERIEKAAVKRAEAARAEEAQRVRREQSANRVDRMFELMGRIERRRGNERSRNVQVA